MGIVPAVSDYVFLLNIVWNYGLLRIAGELKDPASISQSFEHSCPIGGKLLLLSFAGELYYLSDSC